MTWVTNPYRFGSAAAFSPDDIVGLTVWLDASDSSTLYTDTGKTTPVSSDGDNVALWADKSGNGYDVTEDAAGDGPTYKTAAVNSLDALLFNGTSEHLWRANAPINNSSDGSFTVFAVVRTAATVSGARNAVDADDSSAPRIAQYVRLNGTASEALGFKAGTAKTDASGVTIATSTVYLLRSISSGLAIEAFANGSGNGSTAQTGQDYKAAVHLGIGSFNRGASQFWNGHICEVVAYNSDLSAGDISDVEGYLSAKWGV